MGASSSADHGGISEQQQRQEEEENLAAATGFLPSLRNAFSNLASPSSSSVPLASLQEALSLDVQVVASESTPVPEHFPALSNNLGATLVSLFFPVADDRADGRIDWIGFLSGYNRCCGRMPVSRSINVLYGLYAALSREAGAPCGLEFDPDAGDDDKVGGSLLPGEVLMLFWICWVMGHSSRIAKMSRNAKDPLVLPDMSHLLVSALVSCGVIAEEDEHIWRSDVLAVDKGVSAQKFQTWVLTTAPGLVNCLPKYVQERIQACSSSKESEGSSISASDGNSAGNVRDVCLLTTRGRAWAVSLALRDRLSEEFLAASFHGINSGDFLYSSAESSEVDRSSRGWVIGVLITQGFENRETYFGSSGYLFAISPIFHVFPPSGKEKNFMYCHLHPAIRVYEANPKPVGLAFGGSTGNERIFLDEGFAQVTGFLPVEAPVVEVEVWGFGGKTAKEQQDFYKKREMLFSEQRRKVDLKTFASWEDSPEKVMMDMVVLDIFNEIAFGLWIAFLLSGFSFEAPHPAYQFRSEISQIPLVKWKCPLNILLDPEWVVVAGEESSEVAVQDQRQLRILEAIYPRVPSIPPNPSVSSEVQDSFYDDTRTPVIPITAIEDEESSEQLETAAPIFSSTQNQQTSAQNLQSMQGKHDILNLELITEQFQGHVTQPAPTVPRSETTSGRIPPIAEPDVIAAASAAFTAIMKTNEEGSMIDRDLLINILSNPSLVEKLVTEYGPPKQSQALLTPVSVAPPCSSVPVQHLALAPPVPPPLSQINPSAPSPLSVFRTSQMYPLPSSVPPQSVNPHALPPVQIPVKRQSSGQAASRDANYLKSLIQQHGGEKQDGSDLNSVHAASCQNNVAATNAVDLYAPRLQREARPKIPRPCAYFNTPKGCRHGASCSYQHDPSLPQRIEPPKGSKRIKLDRGIAGRN
ncbi:hypothetical protein C4D60_Mb01t22780 [Musa balbisiana]|uniref:C3H1-type domain-containing protein n=1 Tax=Musa balbisiana TaxID=52838 RepID=A0A4S8JQ93_MUSBA|nr:hypothetical protein C4D60_Mb01t22780 [Musa balbisiana]